MSIDSTKSTTKVNYKEYIRVQDERLMYFRRLCLKLAKQNYDNEMILKSLKYPTQDFDYQSIYSNQYKKELEFIDKLNHYMKNDHGALLTEHYFVYCVIDGITINSNVKYVKQCTFTEFCNMRDSMIENNGLDENNHCLVTDVNVCLDVLNQFN